MIDDALYLLALICVGLTVLVILGLIADSWERRDARRRNQARRR